MPDAFQPEIVQLLTMQSHPLQAYPCPDWILALLMEIDETLRFWPLYANVYTQNGDSYDSPFFNTGAEFKNDVFHVQAYSWDENAVQSYNFKCDDIEVSWYKHARRGTTINRIPTPDEGVAMFERCVNSLDYVTHNDRHRYELVNAVLTCDGTIDGAIAALEELRKIDNDAG